MVYPDEFVPLAEETKLILPIGLWVFRSAAEQLRKWQSQFWTTPPLSMSVNLSCRQFSQPDLVYQVERLLLETGLDPRCFKMEITESAIMEQVESASSALMKLKALGVKLALDDFGKGYSSLSYLHQFPFDTLKIDRSFVSRIGPRGENTEIVRTIISLAQGPGARRGRRGRGDGQPDGPAPRAGVPVRPGVFLLATGDRRIRRRSARGTAAVAGFARPGSSRGHAGDHLRPLYLPAAASDPLGRAPA